MIRRLNYQCATDAPGGLRFRCYCDLIDFMKEGHVAPSKSILDVGCGFGSLAKFMRSHGFCDIHGADWKKPAEIESRNPGVFASYTSVDLNECRLEDKFDRKFATIICADVLEHLERPAAVLRSLAHLLEDGGSLYVTLPNAMNIFQRVSWLLTGNSYRYRTEKPGEFGHIALFPSQVMNSLLHRAELKCVRKGKGHAAFAGFVTAPGIKLGDAWSYVSYYEIQKAC